jgi:hypothetical protein
MAAPDLYWWASSKAAGRLKLPRRLDPRRTVQPHHSKQRYGHHRHCRRHGDFLPKTIDTNIMAQISGAKDLLLSARGSAPGRRFQDLQNGTFPCRHSFSSCHRHARAIRTKGSQVHSLCSPSWLSPRMAASILSPMILDARRKGSASR